MSDQAAGFQAYSEQEAIRRAKLQELSEQGKSPWLVTHYPVNAISAAIKERFEALDGQDVAIAGRMTSRRIMGKASFAHLLDSAGVIQCYIKRDDIGLEAYQAFKAYDLGDILGIKGKVFKTQTGEISIHAKEMTLLAKCLKPLPEKWHGLKDVDLRYRRRYVDLIVNPEVREIFIRRSKIISSIRRFLDQEGFLEVETPILQPIPGGGNAKPFVTHHNTLDMDLYLRIAVELYLKKLIVGGLEKVYESGKNFRNEGISYKHSPEFTMLELYQVNADYMDMMTMAETIISNAAQEALGTLKINYQGNEIDLTPPWERMTMVDAVKKYTGLDFSAYKEDAEARQAVKGIGLKVADNASRGDIINFVFEEKVEGELIQPTFIYDYPIEISPLAARHRDDANFTYRFEGFIAGMEVANAFTELNDPIDQRERFEKQMALRAAGDDEAQRLDEDFLMALEYGMPPTGGLGIGIDRIVMLITGMRSIREIILFPPMRPQE